jgi:glutamate-1-semialdehyde 2,1-aminomutase
LPSDGYLQALRDVTRECGILLMFDEVISLRVAPGGAQAWYGVVPDLTAMGKIIGGGTPVGAVGGRADVMRVFGDDGRTSVVHAGTFNGNPLTAAAGLATMQLLDQPTFRRLESLGDFLYQRLRQLFDAHGLAFEVTRAASLGSFEVPAAVRADPRQAQSAAELTRLIQLRLLCHGIKTYGLLVLSTVTMEHHVERLIAGLDATLTEFRPAIEATTPGLLRGVPQAV